MTTSNPDGLEQAWLASYRPIAERALDIWLGTGAWPPPEGLQRDLDRSGLDMDVAAAIESLPRRTGEHRPAYPSGGRIPIRVLQHLPNAAPLLEACMQIVRHAAVIYISDASVLEVRSDDAEMVRAASGNPLLPRAAELISSEYPSPFGGLARGDGSWQLAIHVPNARAFRHVNTLSDYLAVQNTLLAQLQKSPQMLANDLPASPRNLFVLMPFQTEWSTDVYQFIKESAASLTGFPDLQIYRADEISRPGKITDQIVQAIRGADVVIADITGANPNVMWELGFALALDKATVILNQAIDEAPFDLRDWRQVIYGRTPTELDSRKLTQHLADALEWPRLGEEGTSAEVSRRQ